MLFRFQDAITILWSLKPHEIITKDYNYIVLEDIPLNRVNWMVIKNMVLDLEL